MHGPRLSLSHPLRFDEIAYNFSELTMIFEHVGGSHFFEDMVAVIENHRLRTAGAGRLYAGIANVFKNSGNGGKNEYYLGPEKVEDLIWRIGEDFLVYGLAFPWNGVELIKEDLEVISGMDIAESARRKLLGGNPARLYGLTM